MPALGGEGGPLVAVVDMGLGNLFSIGQACRYVGLRSLVTAERERILGAEAVILPGVGAFGTAMQRLRELDLVSPLRDKALSGAPFLGICLGFQLMMEQSLEFGRHRGLGLWPGRVLPLPRRSQKGARLKVPRVGWSPIHPPDGPGSPAWGEGLLAGLAPREYMYFVHSYYVEPGGGLRAQALTEYGGHRYCAFLAQGRLMGCQFHPERSGPAGLRLYRNLARLLAGAGEGARP